MNQLVPEKGHLVLPEDLEERPLLSEARKDVPTTSKDAAQKQASKEKNSKRSKSEQKGSDSKKPRE